MHISAAVVRPFALDRRRSPRSVNPSDSAIQFLRFDFADICESLASDGAMRIR